jgi:polyisoprenoid-binding protein YceI
MKKLNIFLTAFFLVALTASANSWKFDKSHTTIGFDVSHMVIATVDGKFKDFEGTVETEGDNWENAKVNFTAKVNSIDTDNNDRDNHLKSDDFFAAEKYPEITFVGKSMKKVDEKDYKLTGDLTIRGRTMEVTLDVKHNGTITDPWGNVRAGFSITGEINRFDYGLKWDKALDTGGLVVGETVEFDIQVELIQQESKS